MRASFLNRVGEVELREIDAPVLDADQVLVQVCAVGVCGSDVHYYEHGSIAPFVVEQPLILGHESSGIIVAVGSQVDPARVGKRVSIEPQRPCGNCKFCMAGCYNIF